MALGLLTEDCQDCSATTEILRNGISSSLKEDEVLEMLQWKTGAKSGQEHPRKDDEKKEQDQEDLPEGWLSAFDPTYQTTYYYREGSTKTQWERPTAEDFKKLASGKWCNNNGDAVKNKDGVADQGYTLDSCKAACASQASCTAFSFDAKIGWCTTYAKCGSLSATPHGYAQDSKGFVTYEKSGAQEVAAAKSEETVKKSTAKKMSGEQPEAAAKSRNPAEDARSEKKLHEEVAMSKDAVEKSVPKEMSAEHPKVAAKSRNPAEDTKSEKILAKNEEGSKIAPGESSKPKSVDSTKTEKDIGTAVLQDAGEKAHAESSENQSSSKVEAVAKKEEAHAVSSENQSSSNAKAVAKKEEVEFEKDVLEESDFEKVRFRARHEDWTDILEFYKDGFMQKYHGKDAGLWKVKNDKLVISWVGWGEETLQSTDGGETFSSKKGNRTFTLKSYVRPVWWRTTFKNLALSDFSEKNKFTEETDEKTDESGKENASAVIAVHRNGFNADLDERGYQSIASLHDNDQMAAFVRRVATFLGLEIKDEGGLEGMVPFYSGVNSVQTFEKLVVELEYIAHAGSFHWVGPPEEPNADAPAAPAEDKKADTPTKTKAEEAHDENEEAENVGDANSEAPVEVDSETEKTAMPEHAKDEAREQEHAKDEAHGKADDEKKHRAEKDETREQEHAKDETRLQEHAKDEARGKADDETNNGAEKEVQEKK